MSDVTQGEKPLYPFAEEDRLEGMYGSRRYSLFTLGRGVGYVANTRLVIHYAPPRAETEPITLDKSDIAVLLPSEPTIGIYQVLRDEVLAVAQDAERHRAK